MRRSSILSILVLSAAAFVPSAATAVLQRGIQRGLELARPQGPLAVGALAEPTRGDSLEARARDLLVRRGGALGIPGLAGATLELRAVRRGKAVDVVRFRQTVGGVPVHEGELALGFDRAGRVIHVANALRPIAGTPAAAATLAAADARARAFDLLGIEKAPLWERSELVIFAAADRARLAWRIDALLDGAAGGGEWRAFVDATTGEIFRYEDATYYDTGTGQAFLPNPLATAGVLYGAPGYVDGSDADTPELIAELGDVTLLDITFAGGNYSMVGPYAECAEFSAPVGTCPVQPTSNFSWNSRSDDRFEAVNVYFHIDAWMRYANVTLGVPVDPHQYAGGVRYDPRALNGADNSSYNSGTGRLSFGEGGVDDAEDPDVVIHELGHGIHDWMTGGFLSQEEGLSEGVGDYFAVSWMRSFGVWTPSDPQYNWVFAWDGHNPFWGGRVTTWNDNHQYPGDLVGQEHTDGQFWSSCNMDVWEAIGREATDTAMLEGLSMTSSGTNQSAAAQAVLDAAVALGYPVPELESISTLYDDCGYDVSLPWELPFSDGFESGDTTEWSSTQN
jgi:hypothetical protein